MFRKIMCVLGIALSLDAMIFGFYWLGISLVNPLYSGIFVYGVVFLLISLPICYVSIKKLVQIDNNTVAYVYANSPKDATICVFWGIVIGVILICLILGYFAVPERNTPTNTLNKVVSQQNSPVNNKNNASTPKQDYESISAVDLINEFNENEIAANEKYNGKTIIVSGKILDFVSTDVLGERYTYVELSGSNSDLWSLENVQALFEKQSEISKLSNYQKGQEITIKGVFLGKSILNLVIDNCSVVE